MVDYDELKEKLQRFLEEKNGLDAQACFIVLKRLSEDYWESVIEEDPGEEEVEEDEGFDDLEEDQVEEEVVLDEEDAGLDLPDVDDLGKKKEQTEAKPSIDKEAHHKKAASSLIRKPKIPIKTMKPLKHDTPTQDDIDVGEF